MENILEKIVADKRLEIEETKKHRTIEDLTKERYFNRQTISLKESLRKSESGIISEFKRKSPSKGWIHADAEVSEVVKGYCEAGAAAISILTNEKYFGGYVDFIKDNREKATCPILRKEFIIDEFQVYEAKAIGADAILLIAACLTEERLRELAKLAHESGLEVLMEIHNSEELNHMNEYIDVVGVNNRDLKVFRTTLETSVRLAEEIPDNVVKISESGIKTPQDVIELRKIGYRGFLMGETFMKEKDPAAALSDFVAQVTGYGINNRQNEKDEN